MTNSKHTGTNKLVLTSERLSYNPLAADDLDLIIDLWSDPDVVRFMGNTYSKQELIKSHPLIMRRCGDGCIGIWTLTLRETHEKIGTAILLPMPVDEDDTDWDLVVGDGYPEAAIEVGYMLRKSFWGKGFATEACRRMLQFAFEETPLDEIVATIDEENSASRHVLLKSGLKYVGMERAYAADSPIFRLTRTQWLDARA